MSVQSLERTALDSGAVLNLIGTNLLTILQTLSSFNQTDLKIRIRKSDACF
jgi:hypothetical protein